MLLNSPILNLFSIKNHQLKHYNNFKDFSLSNNSINTENNMKRNENKQLDS